MVGIDDSWCEFEDGAGGLVFRHRVREVETDESDVDVLQRPHLRYVFRVTADIDTRATERGQIPVAPTLVVEA